MENVILSADSEDESMMKKQWMLILLAAFCLFFGFILALSYPLLSCCLSVTQCVCEILIIFSVMYIVIVKFSDWQVVSGDGLCLSVEWGGG